MLGIILKWLLFRRGWAATSHLETGGFARSHAGASHPDIQFHFYPYAVFDHGETELERHAFQVNVVSLQPKSSGQLLLASGNPREYPLIDPNYLASQEDFTKMRACIQLSREIFAQPALSSHFNDHEIAPGSKQTSDTDLDKFIRAFADSAYHPSCTCRMGEHPAGEVVTADERAHLGYVGNGRIRAAVTQSNCKVWGLDGLRIVDASIMPSVVSGNLNAPVIMLAERAADLILSDLEGRDRMQPPDPNVKVWKPLRPECQRDGKDILKPHF